MRKLLSVMRGDATAFLWIVKGLLLVLALATLVLWPVSRGKFFFVRGEKYTAKPEGVDAVHAGMGYGSGRVFAWYNTEHFGPRWPAGARGNMLMTAQKTAAREGGGWKCEVASDDSSSFLVVSWQGWGPLGWRFFTTRDPARRVNGDRSRPPAGFWPRSWPFGRLSASPY
jgi:hypothetical protein